MRIGAKPRPNSRPAGQNFNVFRLVTVNHLSRTDLYELALIHVAGTLNRAHPANRDREVEAAMKEEAEAEASKRAWDKRGVKSESLNMGKLGLQRVTGQ